MASSASFEFWQPRRPVPVIDSSTRCRPNRMRTSAILRPQRTSVKFEVETFRIYGKLRRTNTEVHNCLPTFDTIQTEKTLLNFDEKRRMTPDRADYDDFYRTLSSSITPLPSRMGTARSAFTQSARAADTSRHTTFYTLSPSVISSLPTRPLESRQSVYSRLGSSYGPQPDSRQMDRVSRTLPSRSSHHPRLVEGGEMTAPLEPCSEPGTQRLVVESHVHPSTSRL